MKGIIDNLQNYCLGTRYGARSRSRLYRRLSFVRYRHGLEKFLEHHFIPIRRRVNLHDLPTDLLRVQDPFFRGRRPIFSTGNDGAWPAMGTPSMARPVLVFFFLSFFLLKSRLQLHFVVRSFIAYLKL